MIKVRGMGASPGCVMGAASLRAPIRIRVVKCSDIDPEEEVARFEMARENYRERLGTVIRGTDLEEKESAAILEAYDGILQDDAFFGAVIQRVREERVNIDYVLEEEKQRTVALFREMEDEYLQERATDIANVCNELILGIQGRERIAPPLSIKTDEKIIVFADDLTPEDTIKMDKELLGGFVIQRGGLTSHTVILARALGIPAVVGVKDALELAMEGEPVILYGDTGELIIDPGFKEIDAYHFVCERDARIQAEYETMRHMTAKTKDGVTVRVDVNCGESLNEADLSGCDGIGLFRTEYIYMQDKTYPTEEAQVAVYRDMAERLGERELVIRTLDIGGDKNVPYMPVAWENNPSLGHRAIRFSLDRQDVFKTQLRAILRASVYGNVKVMFPMLVNMQELDTARELLRVSMAELEREGLTFRPDIPVGIMIETPAAVWLSEDFARKVDFFSIGTNDLVQYTTATDRMNEKVQYLYDICNPAIIRSVRHVCWNAKKNGIRVGLCGEAASDPLMIPLWIGMGVDTLSVVPSQVARAKYIVGKTSYSAINGMLGQILSRGYTAEVREILMSMTQGEFPCNHRENSNLSF